MSMLSCAAAAAAGDGDAAGANDAGSEERVCAKSLERGESRPSRNMRCLRWDTRGQLDIQRRERACTHGRGACEMPRRNRPSDRRAWQCRQQPGRTGKAEAHWRSRWVRCRGRKELRGLGALGSWEHIVAVSDWLRHDHVSSVGRFLAVSPRTFSVSALLPVRRLAAVTGRRPPSPVPSLPSPRMSPPPMLPR